MQDPPLPGLASQRRWNLLASALFVLAMASVLGLVGYLVAGVPALVGGFLAVLVYAIASQRLADRFELWLTGAHPLTSAEAPGVHRLVALLSERAGLANPPRLVWVPSPVMQAFTFGLSAERASLGLTSGLIAGLEPRELAGILAHELSHLRLGDMRTLSLAQTLARLTNTTASVGWLLLWLNLPLVWLGKSTIPWGVVGVLILAPPAVGLLFLALSRAREFDADAGAVELTGDPAALASALIKVERADRPLISRLVHPAGQGPESPLLSTHPATEERVARLQAMSQDPDPEILALLGQPLPEAPAAPPAPRSASSRRLAAWIVGPGRIRLR